MLLQKLYSCVFLIFLIFKFKFCIFRRSLCQVNCPWGTNWGWGFLGWKQQGHYKGHSVQGPCNISCFCQIVQVSNLSFPFIKPLIAIFPIQLQSWSSPLVQYSNVVTVSDHSMMQNLNGILNTQAVFEYF